jgi:hypothetical protein
LDKAGPGHDGRQEQAATSAANHEQGSGHRNPRDSACFEGGSNAFALITLKHERVAIDDPTTAKGPFEMLQPLGERGRVQPEPLDQGDLLAAAALALVSNDRSLNDRSLHPRRFVRDGLFALGWRFAGRKRGAQFT